MASISTDEITVAPTSIKLTLEVDGLKPGEEYTLHAHVTDPHGVTVATGSASARTQPA